MPISEQWGLFRPDGSPRYLRLVCPKNKMPFIELRTAQTGDDTRTSYYLTQLAHIQRQFDLAVNQLARRLDLTPTQHARLLAAWPAFERRYAPGPRVLESQQALEQRPRRLLRRDGSPVGVVLSRPLASHGLYRYYAIRAGHRPRQPEGVRITQTVSSWFDVAEAYRCVIVRFASALALSENERCCLLAAWPAFQARFAAALTPGTGEETALASTRPAGGLLYGEGPFPLRGPHDDPL